MKKRYEDMVKYRDLLIRINENERNKLDLFIPIVSTGMLICSHIAGDSLLGLFSLLSIIFVVLSSAIDTYFITKDIKRFDEYMRDSVKGVVRNFKLSPYYLMTSINRVAFVTFSIALIRSIILI